MKVSIVLSCYNGSQYIIEQLDSIRTQSYEVDEVIISDDCSDDNTVQIVSDYIKEYGLFNWKLIKNSSNKGWKENFKSILKMAKGEFIFPCDQDDIWHNDKIESMIKIMEANTNIKLLASDYSSFYQDGIKKKTTVFPHTTSGELVSQSVFKNEPLYIKRPGCTYCVRRELIKYFDLYNIVEYPHDAFLWRIANLMDGLFLLNKPLIDYRRHSNTATGNENKNREFRINELDYFDKTIQGSLRFIRIEKIKNKDEKQRILQRYSKWCRLRMELIKDRNYSVSIKLLAYLDCYFSFRTFISDMRLALQS